MTTPEKPVKIFRVTEAENRVQDLKGWWKDLATADVQEVAEKAIEYGSNSLREMGKVIRRLRGDRGGEDPELELELGCWFYAFGKMQRWNDAVLRGDRPRDDSIKDLQIYATMVRRIRDSGGWPDKEGL